MPDAAIRAVTKLENDAEAFVLLDTFERYFRRYPHAANALFHSGVLHRLRLCVATHKYLTEGELPK